jgi:sugar lactone lactonase YvrE
VSAGAGLEVAVDVPCRLGEGPAWDARSGELLWVDILGECAYAYRPANGTIRSLPVGQPAGAIVPRAAGGYALAVRDGFAFLDEAGELTMAAPVEADRPLNRMNDGKCDRLGRFWAGTMATVHEPGAGSLYRLEADGEVVKALSGVTISNGLGWSPDGRTMYYTDTATGGVDAFDFDEPTGQINGRRRLIDIPPGRGLPDGLAVDEKGCLWVALYDGAALCRYRPDGTLCTTIGFPVSLVTSCAFGGPDLRDLYVTTAADRHPGEPLAGAVFRCRPGVAGLPCHPFAG